MAMEERQRQIKEGAGLDESRLNQDLIQALQKWGPYILVGLAVIAGGYTLYNRWQERLESARDGAFQALETAMIARTPAGLQEVATEHDGEGAVAVLAHLEAADAWLSAARSGVPAGMTLDAQGKLPGDAKFLTDAEKADALTKAETAYQSALAKCNTTFGQAPLACGALFGLAAVAEDKGDAEKARGYYAQAQQRAETAGLNDVAALAKSRTESLDKVKAPAKLLATADLPGGTPAAPQTIPMGGMIGTTDTGQKIDLETGKPIDPSEIPALPTPNQPQPIQITPVPAPGTTPPASTPTPAPAPAPAPASGQPATAPKP